ncbi:MAG: aminotransferase class I/II-fold pyridoxal phosphate-dependent enzyme [bacterium]|nr:aminotransferase class I/II-fold pyridoxal phosphate-dependent enzyme [bacterium]
MESLIPESRGRPGNDPIFAINAEAQRRAATGDRVVNASLGALMTDAGELAVMPAVFEAFSTVDPAGAAAYAPIAGDVAFLSAVIDDVFGSSSLAADSVAVATPGGTGAIHHAIVNFLESGDALFTSSYFWSPYAIIASHTGRRVETFEMFAESGRFDLAAFESGLTEQLERQDRALVLFNFPCHNPTGYTLDDDEWEAVADILVRCGQRKPVAFLLDLAYARYGGPDGNRWVQHVERVAATCTLLVAWTASKTFAQYGARVGALIATIPDEAQRQDVRNALSYSCRGTWSNCNHLGILAVTQLLTDPDLRERSDEDRSELVRVLDERVRLFNAEAEAAGLSYPRYEGGFFVAVFTEDANRTAAACREEGVFVVPMPGAVRVALCSTGSKDVPHLVAVLARAIQGVRA